MDDIRIAAVIFNAPLGEVESNLNRMEALIRESCEHGARLVCFPEMALTGYCSDERVRPCALLASDPLLQRLRDLSHTLAVTILTGLAEKDGEGRIYASHFVFIPGQKPRVYRKTHIAPPEAAIYDAGREIPVFDAPGFRFGIQLCYDAHFPFLATRMAEKGVDAIFIPHASPRGTPEDKFLSWMRHIPARAFDNGVYVIVCNQCGENNAGLSFPGLSFVTGPSGDVIEKNLNGTEAILYADLKQKTLCHVREHRMRYFLPNQRKDLD